MQFRDLNRQYEHIKEAVDTNIASVIQDTNFISGRSVNELEEMLASYVGVKHCVSCGNGTDAITIALCAMLDSIPRDQWKDLAVFVPDFTFFSTGECPAFLGLATYFVDVKEDTYNIDTEMLVTAIERVRLEGIHKPAIVIAVDLFGQPAEYKELHKICEKYDLRLIEDSAQGFGGNIEGRMACSFANVATTSFFPAKPLGCYGDGGAIFTNDDSIAELIRSIAVHGKNAGDKYDNVRLGMNSRLDTIQAAVLLAKFPQFRDVELDVVNKVAASYTEQLADVDGLGLPSVPKGYYSSWAQYTVRLPSGVVRDSVQVYMKEHSIPTMVYYRKPMHSQGAFSGREHANVSCPITERLCERVLCLPIHPYLSVDEVSRVSKIFKEALKSSIYLNP